MREGKVVGFIGKGVRSLRKRVVKKKSRRLWNYGLFMEKSNRCSLANGPTLLFL